MSYKALEADLRKAFNNEITKSKKIKNAFLYVHNEKDKIDIALTHNSTENQKSSISQPNYMASVGKIFTSTIISILYDADCKIKLEK